MIFKRILLNHLKLKIKRHISQNIELSIKMCNFQCVLILGVSIWTYIVMHSKIGTCQIKHQGLIWETHYRWETSRSPIKSCKLQATWVFAIQFMNWQNSTSTSSSYNSWHMSVVITVTQEDMSWRTLFCTCTNVPWCPVTVSIIQGPPKHLSVCTFW